MVKEKDREVFVPTAKLGSRRALATYKAGEVFLETDKGERKATGSYAGRPRRATRRTSAGQDGR